MDITDIYRTLHPTREYTFLSSAYGTLMAINHILGYKPKLNKF